MPETRQTSLFEELEEDLEVEPPVIGAHKTGSVPPAPVRQLVPSAGVVDLPLNPWQEVPAPLFNSWSVLRQLVYCRDRDLNGTLYAPTDEESEWFKARADMYSLDIAHMRTHETTTTAL